MAGIFAASALMQAVPQAASDPFSEYAEKTSLRIPSQLKEDAKGHDISVYRHHYGPLTSLHQIGRAWAMTTSNDNETLKDKVLSGITVPGALAILTVLSIADYLPLYSPDSVASITMYIAGNACFIDSSEDIDTKIFIEGVANLSISSDHLNIENDRAVLSQALTLMVFAHEFGHCVQNVPRDKREAAADIYAFSTLEQTDFDPMIIREAQGIFLAARALGVSYGGDRYTSTLSILDGSIDHFMEYRDAQKELLYIIDETNKNRHFPSDMSKNEKRYHASKIFLDADKVNHVLRDNVIKTAQIYVDSMEYLNGILNGEIIQYPNHHKQYLVSGCGVTAEETCPQV